MLQHLMKACVARCRVYASRVFPAALFSSRMLFSRPLQAVSMLAIACLLLSAECRFPTATPGLLNTALTYSTIQIRFLNLAHDGQPRRMQIGSPDGEFPKMPPILPFATFTGDTIAPRNDSALVFTTLSMSNPEQRDTSGPVRFAGVNTVYTLIALPSRLGTGSGKFDTVATTSKGAADVFLPSLQPERAVDTVLALASFNNFQSTGAVRIRAVNCVPDTLTTFDLALGCPSGDAIATSLKYLGVSTYREQNLQSATPTATESITVSLVTRIGNSPTTGQSVSIITGSFQINVRAGQSYALLVYRDPKQQGKYQGKISLKVINEQSSDMITPLEGTSIATNVRVVNTSGVAINSLTVGDTTQSRSLTLPASSITGQSQIQLTGYEKLEACRSVGRDIVRLRLGTRSIADTTSLAANQSYTLLVGKRARNDSAKTIVAPVVNASALGADSAYIRVVSFLDDTVQVQRGLSNQAPQQLLTGTMLFGTMSPRLTVKAGTLPLLVFTAPLPPRLDPQILLHTGIAEIAARKSYFVILVRNVNTRAVEMYVLEDAVNAMPIAPQPMEQGAFVQFVNARATQQEFVMNIATNTAPSNINGNTLFYGRPQMSVLRAGTYTVNLEREMASFGVKTGERRVLVFWQGTDGVLKMLVDTGMKDDVRWQNFRNDWSRPASTDRNVQPMFRYMNVSSDFGRMFVDPTPDGGDFKLSSTGSVNYRAIALGEASFPSPFEAARTYDLRFRRFDNPADSVSVLLRGYNFGARRAYTIIFSGRTITPQRGDTAAVQNYNTIVLQEF